MKTLVLVIVTIAAASVLVVAVSAALSMAALCLIALLTAYVVSPEDIKAVYRALSGKMDAWIKSLSDMTQAMAGAIREAATFAKEATQNVEVSQEDSSETETPEEKIPPRNKVRKTPRTERKTKREG